MPNKLGCAARAQIILIKPGDEPDLPQRRSARYLPRQGGSGNYRVADAQRFGEAPVKTSEAVLLPLHESVGKKPRRKSVVHLIARQLSIGGCAAITALVIDECRDVVVPIKTESVQF